MASEKTKKRIKASKEQLYLTRLHLIEELIKMTGNPGSIGQNVVSAKKNGKRVTKYYPVWNASVKIDPEKEPIDVKLRIRVEDLKELRSLMEDEKERQADELAKREHLFKDWMIRKDANIEKLAKVRPSIEKQVKDEKSAEKKDK